MTALHPSRPSPCAHRTQQTSPVMEAGALEEAGGWRRPMSVHGETSLTHQPLRRADPLPCPRLWGPSLLW